MTVGELITQLTDFDPNIEVRIMNSMIDADGGSPTFEINEVSDLKTLWDESLSEEDEYFGGQNVAYIAFSDNVYIEDMYNVDFNPAKALSLY